MLFEFLCHSAQKWLKPTCRTVPVKIHFLDRGDILRPGNPKAEPRSICKIPDTLRQLGVLLLPTWLRTQPPGRSKRVELIVPTSASSATGVQRFGPNKG